MKKQYCLLIFIFLSGIYISYAQCTGNLLTNGSFTSAEGTAVTAPGWAGTITPDVNDETGPLNSTFGYVWAGTPVASPNGGTWQNVIGIESIDQTVTVIPGNSYTFCIEYAAQGIYKPGDTSLTFINPVGFILYLNFAPAFTSADDTTQFTWETACFTFTSPTASLNILLMASSYNYVGLDGACLLPTVNSSTDEYPKPEIAIYNNPMTDKFEIKTNSNEVIEIIVYGTDSKKIVQQQFIHDVSLNTSQLAKGIYLYEVRNKNGIIKKGKMVKQ